MRAAYAALFLGVVGGLAVGTVVLSDPGARPATVASALGLDGADPPALARRREEAVAVLTQRCMARHGLAWIAVAEPPPAIPDPDLDPVAWADRWGFGLAPMIGRPEPAGVADPNLERMTRMTAALRARYDAALGGRSGDPDDGGCRAEANDAVHGLRERQLAALRTELTALDGAIAGDPGMTSADTTWRRCVAAVADGRVTDRAALVPALMTQIDSRIRALGPGLTGLADIVADERRLAGTIARCEVAYVADRAAVALAHEARFIARHDRALHAAGAAIRAAEAALPTLPPDSTVGTILGSQPTGGP